MKILSLSVLAGALATPVLACDLCSIYSAAQAHGELGKGFFAGAASQFTHFGSLQTDGVKTPNDLPQHLDSAVSQLVAGYNFTDRFGVQFNLPFIHRSFQRPDGAGGIERGTESGLGDVSLTANVLAAHFQKMHFTFRWTVMGGLKLPTGDTGRLYEEVLEPLAPPPPPGAPDSGIHGHDLALGSGSVDGVIGTGIFLRRDRWFLNAGAQYTFRAKGDFDYRYANDLAWSIDQGFYLDLSHENTLAAGFALMYLVKLTRTLRVSPEGELEGLDIHEHGAPAYHNEPAYEGYSIIPAGKSMAPVGAPSAFSTMENAP